MPAQDKTTVLTLHPSESKQGFRIEKKKYKIIRKAILEVLEKKPRISFSEIVDYVKIYLTDNKIEFEGSLPWYVEVVKLDLEAHKLIKRFKNLKPQKYDLEHR
ncbi:MAG: hypothetical protein A3H98_06190 [Bacteroidetes bacterium RIFCSPLOWO2_02_FULL_36_8]|nr:MAG: hypothetical protein A3H98_06190 [Bacteroidetes bacterium RIFCSPLOWO2_02_FULL_36_8]OFY71269.1 MAG: hypothetical protein A3G23_02015 [Bacteroidetes bacterium RIFCSPLOWO2_12_FULL_37_12]